MPRPERPLDGDDTPLLRFAAGLRRLRASAGNPTYRDLGAQTHYSAASLSEAAAGRKLPSLPVTLAYVKACGGDMVEWERNWSELAVGQKAENGPSSPVDERKRREDDRRCPYVGAAVFRAEDAEYFCGRDSAIAELTGRVRKQRFVALVGRSGAGKSSLLRAGLIARAQAAEHGSGSSGPVMLIVPGRHPLEECAVHLAKLTEDSAAVLRGELSEDPVNLHLRIRQLMARQSFDAEMLVVVDQFEEVFTACQDRDERDLFIAALLHAAQTATSRTRVVLGVRSDFSVNCAQHPLLADALTDAQMLLDPMSAQQLRQAIVQPAAQSGVTVEAALLAAVIADAGGQAGALPWVSRVMTETWHRCDGAALTLSGYEASGGIEHALVRTAETAYLELADRHRLLARDLLLRLVSLGEDNADTKRRASRCELALDCPDAAVVLERLTQARLLAVDGATVEFAHGGLIWCWPRLRDWLTRDRDGLRIRCRLTDAVDSWEALHHDAGALYRGTRLALTREWVATTDVTLTPREKRFLEDSIAAAEREHATALRRTRRLRVLLALLVMLLLVAAFAAVYALCIHQMVAEQRGASFAEKAAGDTDILVDADPVLAGQLPLEAYRPALLRDGRSGLLTAGTPPPSTASRWASPACCATERSEEVWVV
ncbi:ABC transporter ATP-binding protein [Amycolatopsis sp. NPDC004079]|uniref:ATP-binding cassette domain-containing protein n=1 Tax=Amycolatopsis sp. NPDC004079 TaxID=3154549 RepID=UPI0033BAA266